MIELPKENKQQMLKTRKKNNKGLKRGLFYYATQWGGGQFGHILVASIAIKRSFKNCVWDPFFFSCALYQDSGVGGGANLTSYRFFL